MKQMKKKIVFEKNTDENNPWYCDVCGEMPYFLYNFENIDYCEDCWKEKNVISP